MLLNVSFNVLSQMVHYLSLDISIAGLDDLHKFWSFRESSWASP